MKVTYWLIECSRDSHAYDIRARTKKAAVATYHNCGHSGYENEVHRITLEYDDAFDMVDNLLSEGGWQCLSINRKTFDIPKLSTHKNSMDNIPAAACGRCGGWTSQGGMSQHRNATWPVMGRTGCTGPHNT